MLDVIKKNRAEKAAMDSMDSDAEMGEDEMSLDEGYLAEEEGEMEMDSGDEEGELSMDEEEAPELIPAGEAGGLV